MGRRGVDPVLANSSPRALYRAFTIRGFRPREAGNLVAVVFGLEVADFRWTHQQVAALLALCEWRKLNRAREVS